MLNNSGQQSTYQDLPKDYWPHVQLPEDRGEQSSSQLRVKCGQHDELSKWFLLFRQDLAP